MTTSVSISVSSNVPVRVGVADKDGNHVGEPRVIQPPSGGASFGIHGEQYLYVIEEPSAPAAGDDFDLPAKTCDLGRPEGCESCQ